MSAIRPALSSCGLFLSQSFETNGATYLTTTVMHESGDRIDSKIELPVNGLPPQQAGSAITYYRRYSIIALLGIAAEDDDGKAAQDAGAKHGSRLTQQLKDSVEVEQENGGYAPRNQPVANKFITDPDFSGFIKETPGGKCWKVTAIQQSMRNFVHDLDGLTDNNELKGFLADNKAALDACAAALPHWYYGKSGSDVPGIEKRISDKKLEFSSATTDDPSKFLRA